MLVLIVLFDASVFDFICILWNYYVYFKLYSGLIEIPTASNHNMKVSCKYTKNYLHASEFQNIKKKSCN